MSKVTKSKNGRNPKTGTKPRHICEYCDKEFLYPNRLERLRRVHTGERPFPCNLCSYSTTQKSNLQVHIRHHLQEKLFKCPELGCNYSAIQSSNLKQHQLVHSQEKRFSCPHFSCSYKTGLKSHLTRHEKTHQVGRNRAKPFQCDLCPFKTTSRQNLDSHMTHIHSTEKRFKCKEKGCSYAGKTKGQLAKHAQSHEEKRLSCPSQNCEYRTNLKDALKKHMNIHSLDKRYQCRICDYAAHRSSNLVRHVRTHTKETPFKCRVEGCSYKAKQRSDLKRHVKGVHEKVCTFQCSFSSCTYASAYKSHLNKHQTRRHSEPEPDCGSPGEK